jgi:type II secretory pathway pseudopilin PulG
MTKAVIRLIRDKRGVSLVELIVSMVLLSFITVAVFAVMTPILRVYTQAGEIAEINTLLDNVANEMIGTVRNITAEINESELDIIFSRSNPNEILLLHGSGYVLTEYSVDDDGVLLKNGVPFFSKAFYKGSSVSFAISLSESASANETAYIITVTITSDRDATRVVSRDYAVVPLVLNQYN